MTGKQAVSAFISIGRSARQSAHIAISTHMSLHPWIMRVGNQLIYLKLKDILNLRQEEHYRASSLEVERHH